MIDPAALCVCGDRFDAHAPDEDYFCTVWREENEAWCYCVGFVTLRHNMTSTNAISMTFDFTARAQG